MFGTTTVQHLWAPLNGAVSGWSLSGALVSSAGGKPRPAAKSAKSRFNPAESALLASTAVDRSVGLYAEAWDVMLENPGSMLIYCCTHVKFADVRICVEILRFERLGCLWLCFFKSNACWLQAKLLNQAANEIKEQTLLWGCMQLRACTECNTGLVYCHLFAIIAN